MYNIADYEPLTARTQSDMLTEFADLGFAINPDFKVAHSMADVFSYIDHYQNERPELAYGIDGIVIKANPLPLQRSLERQSRCHDGRLPLSFHLMSSRPF